MGDANGPLFVLYCTRDCKSSQYFLPSLLQWLPVRSVTTVSRCNSTVLLHSASSLLFLIQGDSVAGGPKLLSIKIMLLR